MNVPLVIIIALAMVLGIGCDKPKSQSKVQTTTTVREHSTIDVAPSTQPATRPTNSTLAIDGRVYTFPPARLVLQQSEPTVDLLLFSDDPPDALSANYSGHRYYFEMKLQIDALAKLAASDMHWKAASIERVDAPDGIFLDGDKRMLQPYDLRVVFSQQADKTYTIEMAGQFLMFQGKDKDESGPPKTVNVRGVLVAELEMKNKKREAATRPSEKK